MALVNGIKIINIRLFVLDRFGPAAWSRLMSVLGDDGAKLSNVEAVGWYDGTLSERLTTALGELFDDDSNQLLMELGRFEANREFATMHRWLVPLVEPLTAIQNINAYWRRSNDTGHWVTRMEGSCVTALLHDWSSSSAADCYRVLGYLARTLQLFGGQVEAPAHPECRVRGAPACVFQARVGFPSSGARPRHRVTVADVPAIGRELSQCSGPDALGQAILTLFRTHLGYQRVGLWSHSGQAVAQLVCSAGTARAADVRRYLLEHRGRVVGKLELGGLQADAGAGDEQVLHEILPWIAVTLEDLPAPAQPAVGAAPAPEGTAGRLERCRQRWRLTPRQSEVLALLVKGRTNGEIAGLLSCREGTVEMHVHSLLVKCGAENRAMLTALFWSDT